MSVQLAILPHHLPAFTREEILAELFRATEDGFAFPAPTFANHPYEERLRTYALFTSEQAERVLRSRRNKEVIKSRLFQKAYPLGAKLRQWFDVHTIEEAMELAQILYRAIGVEIAGDAQGSITVSRCYFSQFYSVPVCDLISALDDGILSGLSGGGRLIFSERITEGCPCCKARLLFHKEQVK